MLSDAQFGDLYRQLRTQGGFTVDVRTGVQPTEGVAIAAPGHEEVGPSSATTKGTLRSYAERHRGPLTEPGMHMGAWEEEGQDYLDRSYVVPGSGRDPMVRSAAVVRMIRDQQRAAWDLGENEEIPNPYFGSADPYGDIKRSYEAARGR